MKLKRYMLPKDRKRRAMLRDFYRVDISAVEIQEKLFDACPELLDEEFDEASSTKYTSSTFKLGGLNHVDGQAMTACISHRIQHLISNAVGDAKRKRRRKKSACCAGMIHQRWAGAVKSDVILNGMRGFLLMEILNFTTVSWEIYLRQKDTYELIWRNERVLIRIPDLCSMARALYSPAHICGWENIDKTLARYVSGDDNQVLASVSDYYTEEHEVMGECLVFHAQMVQLYNKTAFLKGLQYKIFVMAKGHPSVAHGKTKQEAMKKLMESMAVKTRAILKA